MGSPLGQGEYAWMMSGRYLVFGAGLANGLSTVALRSDQVLGHRTAVNRSDQHMRQAGFSCRS